MADITMSKLLFNSVVYTKGVRLMCCNIKNFCLGNLMERYEYLRIPINLIPEEIVEEYGLRALEHNGHIYAEILKNNVWPQTGR